MLSCISFLSHFWQFDLQFVHLHCHISAVFIIMIACYCLKHNRQSGRLCPTEVLQIAPESFKWLLLKFKQNKIVGYFKTAGSPEDCVHMQSKSVSYMCYPKSGIVHPLCDTPIYTQSRGIVFIAYLRRYGC